MSIHLESISFILCRAITTGIDHSNNLNVMSLLEDNPFITYHNIRQLESCGLQDPSNPVTFYFRNVITSASTYRRANVAMVAFRIPLRIMIDELVDRLVSTYLQFPIAVTALPSMSPTSWRSAPPNFVHTETSYIDSIYREVEFLILCSQPTHIAIGIRTVIHFARAYLQYRAFLYPEYYESLMNFL